MKSGLLTRAAIKENDRKRKQASLKSFDPGKSNVCAGSSGQGRGWQRLDVAVEGGVFFVWGTVAGFVFVAVLEVCGLLTLLLTMRFWFKRVEAGL